MSTRAKPTTHAWPREAVVEAVLAGMAEGQTLQDTVLKLKRTEGLTVTPGQVRQWIVRDEAWFTQYQRTKVMLGQAFAEEAIQIARESTNQSTAVDRTLIETLKWAAAKANPVEYGEKQTIQHEGAHKLEIRVVDEEVPTPIKVHTRQALEAGALALPVQVVSAEA